MRRIAVVAVALGLPALVALPAPSFAQTSCDELSSEMAGYPELFDEAARRHPRLYGSLQVENFSKYPGICADLDRDGTAERVLHMYCCATISRSPWAIFDMAPDGSWHIVYARFLDHRTIRVDVRQGAVRAMLPAPYTGRCPRRVKFRVVRWNGERYRSRMTGRRRHRCPPGS